MLVHKAPNFQSACGRENFKVTNTNERAPLFDVDPSISRPPAPSSERLMENIQVIPARGMKEPRSFFYPSRYL